MAELNIKYYTNTDSYSDGAIENDIYDIVRGKKNIEEYYGEYAVIYHLSPSRENIINWYPFDKNASCLEIGAGCGAITGALCQRVKNVVSVDISKKRSEINFERHKNFENLEIIVGNIHEIPFNQKFDYIILNGVFEYAMSFTHTQNNPYIEFLLYVSKLLKNNGRILIAIENRLGLKYFNGAAEDHTGRYFLGLNNYVDNNTVRTFSKNELTNLISKCGFEYHRFYYPYPDYKFPNEIFTDTTISDFNYGKPYYNLNPETFSFFNESTVAKSLSKENVINIFANSFLVEISKEEFTNNVIYAKINSDKNEQFRIATIIYETNNKRSVVKKPLNSSAKEHILNIYKNAQNNIVSSISNCPVSINEEGIYYDYCNCKNMDEIICDLIDNQKYNDISPIIMEFFKPYFDISQYAEYHNEEFTHIFGNTKYNKPLKCINPANIDLICDNIMIDNNKYIIIDTEWIFNINVPILFILWRTIREIYSKHPILNDVISFEEMLKNFNIDQTESEIFKDWALNFINNYVGNGLTESFSYYKKNVDMNTICQLMCDKVESHLYIKDENGYSEENKITKTLNINHKGEFTLRFQLDKKYTELRWDPVENRCCKCKIKYINGNAVPVNSIEYDNGDIFDNSDPQYTIIPDDKNLVIKGEIYIKDIQQSAMLFSEKINNYKGELDYKNTVIQEVNQQNNELNNRNHQLSETIIDLEVRLANRICIDNLSQNYLINEIYSLKEQLKAEKIKHNEIINSKGWKILDKLRKFMILFRR